jgi:hypothetical protein
MTTARSISPLRLCASALIIPIAVHAAPVAIRWTAETSRPAPVDIPAWQGETLHIEPAFASYGTTLPLADATAALYWQTNGMSTAWWSAPAAIVTGDPARVRAIWSPTNDVGASRYTWFISTSSSNGVSYRAYGTLMMRASPGATPSVLGAPTTLTDALQSWGDAHYDPLGTAQAASNALAVAAHAEAIARAAGDAVALTNWQASVNALANGAALGATSIQPSATNGWTVASHDALATLDTLNGSIAAHNTNGLAHADIRDQIDAIPLPPTNDVAGWLVWDSGSNCYWQVTATNLRFYVWGVEE